MPTSEGLRVGAGCGPCVLKVRWLSAHGTAGPRFKGVGGKRRMIAACQGVVCMPFASILILFADNGVV